MTKASEAPAHAHAISRAFVLGAGLGTRLKRLTEECPKPLVPVVGRPLITYAFDHLIAAGVERLTINTHHRAEVYAQAFPNGKYRSTPLTFRHEPVLLETGGGIKNVEDLMGDEPFIVYNGDILSTLPLAPALAYHQHAGNEVTLILRSHGGPLHVAFDSTCGNTGPIADIGNRLGRAAGTHLFTGIYVVSPAFFKRLPLQKISVVPVWLRMITEGAAIRGILVDDGNWWDLGTRGQYLDVHRFFRAASPTDNWVHPTARVAPGAVISGATFIGPESEVGRNAKLHDSVLWNGTKIAEESMLNSCIVTDHQGIGGTHTDADF